MRRLLSHLRSQGIAYLALFVALCGTAYAASLPANSVGTKQLKAGAVTRAKIKSDAITTGKVQDSTLRAQDFASGVLLGGPAGATGATGPTGATGGVDTTILWAVVRAGDGVTPALLARGRHADSATRTALGTHEVKFDREIGSCAYGATLGGQEPVAIPGHSTPISFSLNSKIGSPDTIFVTTAYQSGGALTAIDASFHLIVAC